MPPRNDNCYDVLIGVVVGAHSRTGEVRVVPETDFPERFAGLPTVFVKRPDEGKVMVLTGSRLHQGKGQVILKFAGIGDREAASQLRGAELYITRQQLMPLADGQYYQFELLGLEVVTTTGEALGPVTEIKRTGANDVYVTERALIPAIDSVVKEIDLDRQRIIIEPMEGLIE